jgi:hypothetical protein
MLLIVGDTDRIYEVALGLVITAFNGMFLLLVEHLCFQG